MDYIIKLCNDNSGFISAILAVIAILISIEIGRLPYQKKLSLYHYLDSDDTGTIIATVYVSNVGSCPVYIDKLFAKDGCFKKIGQCQIIENTAKIEERQIKPLETKTFHIVFEGYKYNVATRKKPLLIILKSGYKYVVYRTNWAMG